MKPFKYDARQSQDLDKAHSKCVVFADLCIKHGAVFFCSLIIKLSKNVSHCVSGIHIWAKFHYPPIGHYDNTLVLAVKHLNVV